MNPLLAVTCAAVGLASVTSFVAWTGRRDQRRRSAGRVALLAAAIHRLDDAVIDDLPLHGTTVTAPFVGPVEPLARRVPLSVVGTVALVAGVVVAVLALTTTTRSFPVASAGGTAVETPAPTRRPASPAAPRTAAAPLELMALGHEREQDRLVVRGIVRNPGRGVGPAHLAVVVLLFDADGAFLTSGRAEISRTSLPGAAEVPFIVAIPQAANVGRYRVSFRSDDRVVPHVDRRGQQ
jgi:hypothetical protein